jgi:hypothetical protein
MVVLLIFGGLVAGGAIFAILKNSAKGTKSKYQKLNIG